MPTTTSTSGLIERFSFCAYLGVNSVGLRCDWGSASCGSSLGSSATCSGERLRIQTGLPRHSTVIFSPTCSAPMSTSTGAPAALAFSEGWKVLTKGTAVATPPTAPAQPDAINQVRLLESIRCGSTGTSLMGVPLLDLRGCHPGLEGRAGRNRVLVVVALRGQPKIVAERYKRLQRA